ncbi:unnamed protein product [Caenorhabditis auriculariae]|uniref:Uncharacterized protein n=1 Tax=Caenorhabditis auriculariae TaxID=2777116 RepID=A0A8S1GQP7_9PELO|nr:unnamed protein product [Caenorhabditis auriculariae]
MVTPIPRLRIDPNLSFVPASFISTDDEDEDLSSSCSPVSENSYLDGVQSDENGYKASKDSKNQTKLDDSGDESEENEDEELEKEEEDLVFKEEPDPIVAKIFNMMQKKSPPAVVQPKEEQKTIVVLSNHCSAPYNTDSEEEELQFELEF